MTVQALRASMPLPSLFADFSALLHSPQFHEHARHSDHVTAFRRRRKLPLPTLVAVMLCGMRKSIHAELDEFFGHLRQQASLAHEVSEQAFASARAKLGSARKICCCSITAILAAGCPHC